jgi:O-antigen/teichoic acid export membrane protein
MIRELKQMVLEVKQGLQTKGSFVQNSAWMFSSSGLSIAIQFLFFPLLARIYSPEEYGVFGVFNFYTTALGSAVTLGYSQAFVLPSTERSFGALLRLTLWLTVGISAAFFLFTCVAGGWMLSVFKHEQLGAWVYFIAPVGLFMALDRVMGDWAIRQKEFKKQMVVSTSITAATKIFNVLYGVFHSPVASGLMLTAFLQHFLRTLGYGKWVIASTLHHFRQRFSWNELKSIGREYKAFPLFMYWGGFINILSNNFPSALLPRLGFGWNTVGFYNYSLLVLDIPLRLFGAGITSVFTQKAAELSKQDAQALGLATWKLFKYLTVVSFFFLLGMNLLGEWLYRIAFGAQWAEAGKAAEILSVYYFFRMLSAPLTALFNILRKEKEFLIFQVGLMVVRAASLWIGSLFTHSFLELMVYFTVANAVAYLVLCGWLARLVSLPASRLVIWAVTAMASAMLLAYGAKWTW